MVRAQGGDPDAPLPEARERVSLPAPGDGYVTKLDARAVGIAAWRLGAGRARKEDPVSPAAGALCLKKPGDQVLEGEPVLELHADDPGRFEGARAALENAFEVAPDPPEPRPLILERIGS
jgi:thymidine phosphorylase